ncbi:MAG: hypothetical protein CAPSK01_000534 [Candidatus Accumulibacter vicinus]|uniref:Uncharacterized protein n=1 Tax=Candidatus Accumulibacter vicinus TaxID=2954382 RepID=A0A084Y527_9PROT|nr:MAG: hypothetical protein CAPSK01_000534 [Candidatus Accumulibacter vicinus]
MRRGASLRRFGHDSGRREVEQRELAAVREVEEVVRIDVAMHDAGRVYAVQCGDGLQGDA